MYKSPALWLVFVSLSALISSAGGDVKRLPVTADVGLCGYSKERSLNTGGRSRVRIKGIEHHYLFAFDAAAVRKWKIDRATLHLKQVQGRLRRMAICTVPIPWPQGTAGGQVQRGSSCYTHVKYPQTAWTPGGGAILAATFNSPRMMWRPAQVTREGQWLKIDVAPELVHAVAHGLSHGLLLADEAGQTRENHDVYTREQSNARPYLEISGRVAKPVRLASRPTFRAEACAAAAGLKSGAIRVAWQLPPGVAGTFSVRVDLTGADGFRRSEVCLDDVELVVAGLAPRTPYGVTVNFYHGPDVYWSQRRQVVSSAASRPPKVPSLAPAGRLSGVARGQWRVLLHPPTTLTRPDRPAARAAATLPVPVTARNAWVALGATVFAPPGAAAKATVSLSPPLKHARLYRTWYVPSKSARHAEVLAEIRPGEPIDIPWQRNNVPGQICQQILVDLWVPKDAAVGARKTNLVIRPAGAAALTVPIRIDVGRAVLPDTFHIVGGMNAYSSPARAMGADSQDAAAFLAAERAYYRLAHAHRMTLNVLPYSQSGSIDWRGAPKIAGRGAQCRVTDWRAWDERFGPLLSGEAFSPERGYVGPGAGVPIEHMYLPFHENWPARLREHFRPWPPPKDYQKLLVWLGGLPAIEKCFDEDSRRAWLAVLKQFRDHLRAKKWTRTRCEVYMNDKYYFRKNNGRGVSLWLLDEPMFTDDFLALAYFGRLTKAAGGDPLRYRIDISRPTHQRNWLDGLVELNVCAGQLHAQRRQIAHRRRRFGEQYWNYAMPPSFGGSNIGWAVWPIRSYCWGAVGTLPWQTIAGDRDLSAADPTALMYPPGSFGLSEPLPSLRMTAWRTGLQDAELLRLARRKHGWSDIELRAWVGQVCGLSGWSGGMDPPATGGIVTFGGVTHESLDRLRRATMALLTQPAVNTIRRRP